MMRALCSHGSHLLGYRHNCLVVYRRRLLDLWRVSFWVVCVYCDETHGPHRERSAARSLADAFNHHDQLPGEKS